MSESNFPTVDPEIAAQETDNWREYYASTAYAATQFKGDIPVDSPEFIKLKEEAFRGFRIPLNDLRQIMENIDEHNHTQGNEAQINSVRIYLARGAASPDIATDPHVYLVPVLGGEAIPNPLQKVVMPSKQEYGSDLLKINDGKGALYNFSTPCPKQCDIESILFSLKNMKQDNETTK